MRKAFSLAEILIVVAILGILAAVVVPTLKGHISLAKEASAKDNLRLLRNAIEQYASQHNDVPPGYPNGDTTSPPREGVFFGQLCAATNAQGQIAPRGTPGYDYGPYLSKLPKNPFNQQSTPQMVESFPEEATGPAGWLYNAATKEIRLNWPGTDTEGKRYYDY